MQSVSEGRLGTLTYPFGQVSRVINKKRLGQCSDLAGHRSPTVQVAADTSAVLQGKIDQPDAAA